MTCMHIVLHYTQLENKQYIRIVNTSSLDAYTTEYTSIYKQEIIPSDIHVFHNHGDVYERIVSDMKFKKFKQFKIQKMYSNLLEISDASTDVLQAFRDFFQSKINIYIQDEDDADYFQIPKLLKDDKKLVKIIYDDATTFELLSIEKTPTNSFAMSKQHLFALAAVYIDQKCIDMRDAAFKFNSGDSQLEVCIDLRSIIINTNKLTCPDIERIFETLGFSIDFIKSIQRTFNDDSPSSYEPYAACCKYAQFNFDQQELSHGLYESFDKPIKSTIPLKSYVYENLISNIIYIFEKELEYLAEFKKHAPLDQVSSKISTFINTHQIKQQDIQELQTLLSVFESSKMNRQHELTKQYVEKHKNDNEETLATIVVDNVKRYLNDHIDVINQNQIGQDLVELGVIKTRKSKGYVYGINDTNNLCNTPKDFKPFKLWPAEHKPHIDKIMADFRPTPQNIINTDLSKFNMSSTVFAIPKTTEKELSIFKDFPTVEEFLVK